MLNWLAGFFRGSRVSIRIKETKCSIESYEPRYRAQILAFCSFNIHEVFREMPVDDPSFIAALNYPSRYSGEALMQHYYAVEGIRRTIKQQMDHAQANSKNVQALSKEIGTGLGPNVPSSWQELPLLGIHSCDVILSTLGAGIERSGKRDVLTIWRCLVDSKPHLSAALDRILKVEEEMRNALGGGRPFFNLDRSKWMKWCEFAPEEFYLEKRSLPQGFPEIHSLTYDDVEKFFDNATACLNKEQAPLFKQGMQVAFFPIQQAVGGDLGFGDIMRRYAELTKENPDEKLNTLLTLKFKDTAVEAGYLYIVALLALNYGHFGVFPAINQGNVLLQNMQLTESATCILEKQAQYNS